MAHHRPGSDVYSSVDGLALRLPAPGHCEPTAIGAANVRFGGAGVGHIADDTVDRCVTGSAPDGVYRPATEFDIQGLELDWVGVCRDADFRSVGGCCHLYRFSGTRWQNVNDNDRKAYLI